MKKVVVWIISDGLPGHYNQSYGLLKPLARYKELQVELVDVRLRFKPFRTLMRWLVSVLPCLAGFTAFRFFYRLESVLPSLSPDIIVSAGGNTLFANASLARQFRAANYFSGTLKGYPSKLYRNVFTVVPLDNAPNNIVLDLPPTNVEPGVPADGSPSGLYVLLVGGDGAGYHYTDEDWHQLANLVNETAHARNIRWLVTTSRRSGDQCESILREQIDKTVVERAVWWGRSAEPVMQAFLKKAEKVFCTEDSLTMVAEAIYSNRPVVTLQSASADPDSNDRQALEQYSKNGYINRVKLSEADSVIFTGAFNWAPPDFYKQGHRVMETLLAGISTSAQEVL